MKVLQEPEKEHEKRNLQSPSLQEISKIVADYFGLHFPRLISRDRTRTVSKARAAISYLAVDRAGYTQAEVGNHLNISRIGVRNSMLRGEKMVEICQEIWKKVI